MSELVCGKRDGSVKIKQLRRDGFVPASIYGKNLEASIHIQLNAKEVITNKKTLKVGSQVSLIVDGEAYDTLVKSVDYSTMTKSFIHFEFQALTAGETVKTSIHINYINKDQITDEGNVQEHMSAIEYEVLPKDMIKSLDVDLSVLTLSKSIKLSDLAIADDERYHLITDRNTTLVSLAAIKEMVLETEETDEVVAEVVAEEEEEA